MIGLSLQARLVRYLSHHPGVWVNGAELGDRAHALPQHYKHDTVSRRLRVLVEASHGIETTPEHVNAKRILRASQGQIERVERKSGSKVASVFYRFVEGEKPKPKFEYRDLSDGSKLEVAVNVKSAVCRPHRARISGWTRPSSYRAPARGGGCPGSATARPHALLRPHDLPSAGDFAR
jgi:hypothetical protein